MDTRLISEKIKDRILTTTLIQTVYLAETNHSNGMNNFKWFCIFFNDVKWLNLGKRESSIIKQLCTLYRFSLHESNGHQFIGVRWFWGGCSPHDGWGSLRIARPICKPIFGLRSKNWLLHACFILSVEGRRYYNI